jgi:hypothetical protein
MRSQLQAWSSRQGGLFTRRQALAAGYTDREVKANIRTGGSWAVVANGVYVDRAVLDAGDHRDKWLLRDRAALMTARVKGILTHDSAARVLDIPMLDVDVPASHITVVGEPGSRRNGNVVRHRDLLPLCAEVIADLPCSSYARTAVDIGRLHGYRHGLVAVDAVRNMGVPLSDLEAELARMSRHPYIARARAAVEDSDAGAESVLETLARELIHEMQLGPTETQFAVPLSAGKPAWCDIRVGLHLFECQGLVKLVSTEQGGFAKGSARDVIRGQKTREAAIAGLGLGVSEIYWDDLFGARREEAKRRLRAAYDVTVRRFGTDLPLRLRQFADANPRRGRAGDPWRDIAA